MDCVTAGLSTPSSETHLALLSQITEILCPEDVTDIATHADFSINLSSGRHMRLRSRSPSQSVVK
jgi:hypothetical protein